MQEKWQFIKELIVAIIGKEMLYIKINNINEIPRPDKFQLGFKMKIFYNYGNVKVRNFFVCGYKDRQKYLVEWIENVMAREIPGRWIIDLGIQDEEKNNVKESGEEDKEAKATKKDVDS